MAQLEAMLDVKIFGRGQQSVILQVGCVVFALGSGSFHPNDFLAEADVLRVPQARGKAGNSLKDWWKYRNAGNARVEILNMAQLVMDFGRWTRAHPTVGTIWTVGTTPGLNLLRLYTREMALPIPWLSQEPSDSRALFKMARGDGWKAPAGLKLRPNARADARTQATAHVSAVEHLFRGI